MLCHFRVIWQFQLRFYGIIFITLFIALVLDASLGEYLMKQSDNPIPLKGVRETINIFKRLFNYLIFLRKNHPGTVCSV